MYPYQLVIPAIVLSALVIGAVLAFAARSSRRVRRWLALSALGIAAMPLAIVLHNVLSAFIEGDEAISFIVALAVAPLLIAIGLVGVARVLLRERRDLGIAVALGAAGIGTFALYMLFLLIVTTAAGGNPTWQGVSDAIVMTAATLAAAGGALSSVLVSVRGGRPATA